MRGFREAVSGSRADGSGEESGHSEERRGQREAEKLGNAEEGVEVQSRRHLSQALQANPCEEAAVGATQFRLGEAP
ncbi:hypothetical protein BESB_019340 [Besnoitia besnoiti]|uniref:Uncharacterized protein n=1 Tax=Besnoitia besnoiti TaxID=94643 RepID=A0A2A9M8H8_BESBE|nr:hypothetical protein BESB_019340 [Besnoitia besnoiti]PFH31993.1 hypothetical protein BESB_019340 [Besnoitia besnoiti]